MIDLFEHNHPEHYGEMLQTVLNLTSAPSHRNNSKIPPEIFSYLLNSLYRRAQCDFSIKNASDTQRIMYFKQYANQQNLLNFKEVGFICNLIL